MKQLKLADRSFKSNLKRLLPVFFLLLFALSISAQIRPNHHNQYLSNSEVFWLQGQKIDFRSAPVTDAKIISSAKNAILHRNLERRATATSAAWGAAGGIASIVWLGTFINSNDTSFREDAIGSVIGVFGLVASGLSVKYYLNKKKQRTIKQQHIEMCQLLSKG